MSVSTNASYTQTFVGQARQWRALRSFWCCPLQLLTALLAVVLARILVFPMQFEVWIAPERIQPRWGLASPLDTATMPGFEVRSNGISGRWSRLGSFEDGKEPGPPGTLDDEIAEKGIGRFSHWAGALYFSASDRSDPRTNGRTCVVRAPIVTTAVECEPDCA